MGPGDVHWWHIWIIMMLTDSTYESWRILEMLTDGTYGSWTYTLLVHMDPGDVH